MGRRALRGEERWHIGHRALRGLAVEERNWDRAVGR